MKLVALVVSCAALAACEKAGTKEPLAPEEMALLQDIPGGNIVLVGGNLMKIQSDAMGKLRVLMGGVTGHAQSPEGWSDCFVAHPNDRVVSGISISIAPQYELRMVFHGETIETIETCATKEHYPITVDPDRKYIAMTVGASNGAPLQIGFLQLPDGNLLTDVVVHIGQQPPFESNTRAQLDAVAATLATSNAGGDTHLLALAAKANRTKTFWFASSAATTSLSKELGDVYGDVDIATDAVSFDVTAAFTDLRLAERFEKSYERAKGDTNGPEILRSFTNHLSFTRNGGTIHAAARTTFEQLQTFAAMAFH